MKSVGNLREKAWQVVELAVIVLAGAVVWFRAKLECPKQKRKRPRRTLYIEDTETGNRFMLAKADGEQWRTWNRMADLPDRHHDLDAWLEGRDPDACRFRRRNERRPRTQLRLVAD